MRRFRLARPATWSSGGSLWWLNPALLLLVFVVPLYLSFLGFNFEKVVPRRYIPSTYYVWGLLLLLALAGGSVIGALLSRGARMPAVTEQQRFNVPPMLTAGLLLLTVAAYVIWFGPLAFQLDKVLQIFMGERGNLRDTIETQPGITTFTQCGAAYVVVYVLKRYAGTTAVRPWERAGLLLVIVLAVVRAVLWSERLAVLEVLLTYVVARVAFIRFRHRNSAAFASFLPFIAPFVLYLLFTATEYFRSWNFYKAEYSSIWQFSFERLTAYYAVAANSGIGLLQEARGWPHYTGRFVFEWAYVAPGLGSWLTDALGDVRVQYSWFLETFGREEFNNPTGIFPIVFDIGYFGSMLYFLLAGALVGATWMSYRRQRVAGLLFYPFFFLFMLELLRFNYLAASRFVPIVASLLLACMVIGRRRTYSSWQMPFAHRQEA